MKQARLCEVEHCVNKHWAKGCCVKHYARLKRGGSTDLQRRQHDPDNFRLIKLGKLRCLECNRTKALHLFYKQKVNPLGYRPLCKSCYKKVYQKTWRAGTLRVHDLTTDDYEVLLEEHEGQCWICGGGSTKSLSVDHNHSNGYVRGLLCSPCNRALGKWKDDPEVAMAAYRYLHDDGGRVRVLLDRQPISKYN